jgi:6-phosphofructokinase 1
MRIGICTGGGDCPGLNVAIQAAVRQIIGKYNFKAFGIRESFNGLMDDPVKVLPLEMADVSDIHMKGGTILGTHSSGNPYAVKDTKQKAIDDTLQGLKDANLDGVLVIGGEGTQGIAALLDEHGLPLVGIPKTIDNDLPGTDLTIGFSTACDTIRDATEKLHSTAESHDRVMVLEVMGRNSGSLALEGGLAGNAHIILIPELPFSMDEVISKIKSRQNAGRKFSVVVVAEGAFEKGDKPHFKKTPDEKKVLGGIGKSVADKIQNATGIETRITVLGHLQRGGVPNLNDKLLAARFASKAVDLLASKKFGIYLGIKGDKIVEHQYKTLDRGIGKPVPSDHDYISTCENTGTSLGRKLNFKIK